MKQTSLVWDYFTEKGDWVTCIKCPKTYKLATAQSSTQPLRYHLKTKHNVDFDNAEKSMPSEAQDIFTREIGLFIAERKQTAELQLLHQALRVVPPASVEAERGFSAGGLF